MQKKNSKARTASRPSWRRGRPRRIELDAPEAPYTMRLADGRTVFVEVPGRMVTRDRGGELAFTPEGVQFLDRVRALAMRPTEAPSPAYITALREALGLTQAELGRRIGRNKLTISRWERGELRPGEEALKQLFALSAAMKRSGIVLAG